MADRLLNKQTCLFFLICLILKAQTEIDVAKFPSSSEQAMIIVSDLHKYLLLKKIKDLDDVSEGCLA